MRPRRFADRPERAFLDQAASISGLGIPDNLVFKRLYGSPAPLRCRLSGAPGAACETREIIRKYVSAAGYV
jgi:hypothetical protein